METYDILTTDLDGMELIERSYWRKSFFFSSTERGLRWLVDVWHIKVNLPETFSLDIEKHHFPQLKWNILIYIHGTKINMPTSAKVSIIYLSDQLHHYFVNRIKKSEWNGEGR